MPASISIDESNGAGETVTQSVSNMNYVTTDAANQNAPDYPMTPVSNTYAGSFTKWHRLHVQTLNAVSKVKNIRFWRSAGSPTSGDLHQTWATTGTYVRKAYAQPSTALMTGYVMPSSEPASANIGINSSLTGEITVASMLTPGLLYSDYIVHQVQVSAGTTAGAVLTVRVEWDEIS